LFCREPNKARDQLENGGKVVEMKNGQTAEKDEKSKGAVDRRFGDSGRAKLQFNAHVIRGCPPVLF